MVFGLTFTPYVAASLCTVHSFVRSLARSHIITIQHLSFASSHLPIYLPTPSDYIIS